MLFWIVAIAAAVIATVWILYPLLRPKASAATRSAYDVQIYKDQLKEVETDLARGTLTEEEAKASRTEVSRRLLAADAAQAAEHASGNAPKNASRILAAVVATAVLGGSVILYFDLGVPGLPDLPLQQRLADRPTQEEAEKAAVQASGAVDNLPEINQPDPRHVELVAQLQEVLKDRPDDLLGHRMLADNLAQLGRYIDARKAQSDVMRILGEDATADDWSAYAEIMIVAADYYVSPEAENALTMAINLDKTNPRARYYAGIAMLQREQPERTYQIWNDLLEEGPADAPWIPIIENQIDAVAAAAGINRPAATRGPSAADIQAAGDMTEEERNSFIRSMVARLSERLASQGGTADEWAQPITALGNLGETDKAAAIWGEAQTTFAEDPAGLKTVTEAARGVGIAD